MDTFRSLLDVHLILIEKIGVDKCQFDFNKEINFTVGNHLQGKITNRPFDLTWHISTNDENKVKQFISETLKDSKNHIQDENELYRFRFNRRDELINHISNICNK